MWHDVNGCFECLHGLPCWSTIVKDPLDLPDMGYVVTADSFNLAIAFCQSKGYGFDANHPAVPEGGAVDSFVHECITQILEAGR